MLTEGADNNLHAGHVGQLTAASSAVVHNMHVQQDGVCAMGQLRSLEAVGLSCAYVSAEHFPATLAILHLDTLLPATPQNCHTPRHYLCFLPVAKASRQSFPRQNKMPLHPSHTRSLSSVTMLAATVELAS